MSTIINYKFGAKNWSARPWLRLSGDWAVVTGACGLLGRAYSCELASEKLNVLLIDADKGSLNELAADIDQKYGVRTKITVADLTTTKDYDEITKSIDSLPSIGCVVNAAELRPRPRVQPQTRDNLMESFDFIERMAICNMQSMALITRLCLVKMLRQPPSRAAIINVSSSLAWIPCPNYPLYAASKSFVFAFSRAIRAELRLPFIIVQSVHPGPLNCDQAPDFVRKTSTILAPSPTTFVQSALDMLGVEDETSGYFPHAIWSLVMAYLPQSLIKKFSLTLNKATACTRKIR
ncbi:hypothetical protein FGIG_04865 [Fasciola gigantica]|uniref:Uncharacterized protein n=1 Tax=Fasciola gigantica TaxID=46835 RepID=A0A504YNF3_FASGI|nr:hypothetical protein FGIG_04865 [Fasciola gigantica]